MIRARLAAIRRELQQLDPTLPLYDAKTSTEHMNIPLFPAKIAAGVRKFLACSCSCSQQSELRRDVVHGRRPHSRDRVRAWR